MPSFVIQPAISADADAIASIGSRTFFASFAHSMPAEHMQEYLNTSYSPAAIAAELAAETTNKFYVARSTAEDSSKGKVIGFVQMKLGTTEPCVPTDLPIAELHRIYMDQDFSGGGVGKELMRTGMDWAAQELLPKARESANGEKGKGRAAVWLGVWEENFKAQQFYQRAGFEKIGAHDFVMGDTTQTDWVLMKFME